MSRIDRLLESYKRHISLPWREVAPEQRIIFCIYNGESELKLRAKIFDFEEVTRKAGHDWAVFDLTDSFADWMSSQKYAKSYYQQPSLIVPLLPKYGIYIGDQFKSYLQKSGIGENHVVALVGAGTLFGFLRIKEVVEMLAPLVKGRLVVFFPGSYENNNYRLLDGYDGWNYHAVPITADDE